MRSLLSIKTCRHIVIAAAITATGLAQAQAAPSDAHPLTSQPVPFLVTLGVPNESATDGLEMSKDGSAFDVNIKNISPVPQTIWKGQLSCGYYDVSVRITEIDGKRLSPPIYVARRPRNWSYNRPDPQTLKPGEQIVWHLLVSELDARLYYPLTGRRIKAVALFNTVGFPNGTSPAMNAHFGVWSGRAVSSPSTFLLALPTLSAWQHSNKIAK